MAGLPNLKSLAPAALRACLRDEGEAAFRAEQLLEWLYAKGVEDPRAMSNLPAALRERLAAGYATRALETEAVQLSRDGTRKLALRAADGAVIETVVIPEARRTTLCVSTQVGCSLACSFCATGALGLARNLTTAEIVDQVCRAREAVGDDAPITNVVFMGMGEPLLNLANVRSAIELLVHPKAFAMAPRRITVSTAGLVPRIHDLLAIAPIHLAVSLHATTDEVRDELVPLNRRFPLDALLGALREEPLVNRRRPVFFEYTLMAGVNDSIADARRLPKLLRGIPAKVNVIPMNPHADAPYGPPADEVVDRFTAEVHAGGLRVTLRRDRGRDIDAACGQLAARGRGGTSPARAAAG
ncbi:MAG: 23S rRNA (adenine(2503)-C(2))-methyltransferase RlmN [Myxococcales bacterium]|nr:23S rRNA (adenine(2503)-C(2))-methyltransferase RlmN [Myxococcales bacterium]